MPQAQRHLVLFLPPEVSCAPPMWLVMREHYAPGNMGVDVVLATLQECAESATTGRVTWNRDLFT